MARTKDEVREVAKHRFLEAWMQLRSKVEGHTLSHVELSILLDYGSPASINQQMNREKNVADMTLIRIRRINPEYSELIDSLLLDSPSIDYDKKWRDEIEKIHQLIRDVAKEVA